jgi:hydroxymethylglutaryl-CoA synthase
MSVLTESEDTVSMALTGNVVLTVVLDRLMHTYEVDPKTIGRVEVGTETLVDKSKSIKSFLMDYFAKHSNHDIEGIMSVHACYGGTAALFNTIAWMESQAWDGRFGIVIMSDIAIYEEGSSRATAGCGAVALLIKPDAEITCSPIRSSFMAHSYDFYKPNMNSESPVVNGRASVESYLNSLVQCYRGLRMKHLKICNERISLQAFDQVLFHTPFYKQVKKAFLKLCLEDV